MIHLLAVILGYSDFSICHMLDNMFMFLVDGNWFFAAYLGLYLFAPILNAYIENVDTKQLGWMIVAFYLFQTIFGWVFKSSGEFSQGLTFVSFFGLYLLGAYLKRSTLKYFQFPAKVDMMIYLGVGMVCVIGSMMANYVGFNKDVYSYISPLQIVQTIYLFCFFRKVRVSEQYGRWIFFFSSSAFAALLMHSWDGVRIYAKGLYWIDQYLPVPFLFTVIYIILYFCIACCLDKIRIFAWNYSLAKVFK